MKPETPMQQNRVRAIHVSLIVPIALAGLLVASMASAHGAQIDVGQGAKGPVRLTAAQEKTLAVKVARAELRPLSEMLYLNGEVRQAPERQTEVSTRISGQVTALYARLGDSVKAGQKLARVQSRLVGDPPPSVDILAPRGGAIDAVGVVVGQSVEPATTLFKIGDRSQVDVVARVYEEDLGKLRVGQPVSVRTLAYPGRTFEGSIAMIGPTLDPQTRTVEAWIPLANPDGALKPNLFARVGVVLRQNATALAVPNATIIEANGEKFVFVRQKGQYARVEVVTGASDDRYTEIKDGLVPGDEVVTQGNREIYTVWLTGGAIQQEDD